jgi:hypothetical protein
MGLDFSHGDAHWAYGGFQRFRERLAEHEGFDLNEMHGFCAPWRGHDPEAHPDRPWSAVTTPLKPLLNHSDCDGVLTPAECAQVEPRLTEIVSTWPEGDYDRMHAETLAAAMRLCIERDEELGFQ